MLYIMNESIFTGYNEISLDVIYLIAILAGTLVIISKNPIISVLFLIGLFLSISSYLILTWIILLLVMVGSIIITIKQKKTK